MVSFPPFDGQTNANSPQSPWTSQSFKLNGLGLRYGKFDPAILGKDTGLGFPLDPSLSEGQLSACRRWALGLFVGAGHEQCGSSERPAGRMRSIA